jgi:hypothetical protein
MALVLLLQEATAAILIMARGGVSRKHTLLTAIVTSESGRKNQNANSCGRRTAHSTRRPTVSGKVFEKAFSKFPNSRIFSASGG